MSIRLRGSKFQVRVTVNGRTVTQSFDTRIEAQRWETQQKVLLAHGIVEQSKPVPAPSKFTLTDAIAQYSAEILPGKRGQGTDDMANRFLKANRAYNDQRATCGLIADGYTLGSDGQWQK